MGGGRAQIAVAAAAIALSGCVPPGALAADTPPSVAPRTPATAPEPRRLALDLTQLKDERPIWERRPVVANAIVQLLITTAVHLVKRKILRAVHVERVYRIVHRQHGAQLRYRRIDRGANILGRTTLAFN